MYEQILTDTYIPIQASYPIGLIWNLSRDGYILNGIFFYGTEGISTDLSSGVPPKRLR